MVGRTLRKTHCSKSSFYKSVGQGLLSWDELCKVVLDIEVSLNHRPLSYVEDDPQFPTLTPNSSLLLNANSLPELEPHRLEDRDLRKRAKFLKATKDTTWRRWTTECHRALTERHQLKHNTKPNSLSVGDVVIIKSNERNRNQWPMGVVEELFTRPGGVRAAKLRVGRGFLERPIQHLYPLELSCNRNPTLCNDTPLNPTAVEFRPRSDAAVARIQDIVEQDIWMWLPKKHYFYTYFLLCNKSQFHLHMSCSQVIWGRVLETVRYVNYSQFDLHL